VCHHISNAVYLLLEAETSYKTWWFLPEVRQSKISKMWVSVNSFHLCCCSCYWLAVNVPILMSGYTLSVCFTPIILLVCILWSRLRDFTLFSCILCVRLAKLFGFWLYLVTCLIEITCSGCILWPQITNIIYFETFNKQIDWNLDITTSKLVCATPRL
jgi:hypothetical protein